MKAQGHCTSVGSSGTTDQGETVSIYVDYAHPLLTLKRALPWEAISAVMRRRWSAAGKNVDGRPGRCWDVSLYMPLVVLMLVKNFHARQMEAYVAENVVARVFIGRQDDPTPQIRDHANIARAYAALGKAGVDEVNTLILNVAKGYGCADPGLLSADTTAQELPIGYPNEPGILRGLAQRCVRALENLTKHGVQGVDTALDHARTVLRSVKAHHLFAKGQEDKQQLLTRIMAETEHLLRHTRQVVERLGQPTARVKCRALTTLTTMQDVARQLIPQIIHWMTTGVVAKGKILHAGLTQARAIVRNKAGKKVEFGLQYLLNRIGGGYLFGTVGLSASDESKMPLRSLTGYRQIFGPQATPELLVYDRGGYAKATLRKLAKEGVKHLGIQPKGKGAWLVAEEVRERIRSERGKTEGIIGTLKTDKYGFNKPKERQWQTLQMAGPSSILSFNLNKLMRDLVKSESALQEVQC